jgi:hypothetical protein
MGTAKCGPACLVVWGLGEKNPRLPDYALNVELLIRASVREIIFTQSALEQRLLAAQHKVPNTKTKRK